MAKGEKIKYRIYKAMTHKADHKVLWLGFDIMMLFLILTSTALSIISGLRLLHDFDLYIEIAEYICVAIFAIEWLLHFLVAEYLYPNAKSLAKARLRWMISISSIIDFICLITLILGFIPEISSFRYLKLFKLIKLLKIPEYLWFWEPKVVSKFKHKHTEE